MILPIPNVFPVLRRGHVGRLINARLSFSHGVRSSLEFSPASLDAPHSSPPIAPCTTPTAMPLQTPT